MSDMTRPPPLGLYRDYMERRCAFGLTYPKCDKAATWHVVWTGELENSIACDEHMAYAQRYAYYDRHPITEVCTFPATNLVWSWDEPPGRCVWVVDDETMVAVERSERVMERVR